MQRIVKAKSLDELVNQVNILLARGATTTAENMAITPAGMGMAVAGGPWGGGFIQRGTDTVMALLDLPPALVLELAAEEAAKTKAVEDAEVETKRRADADAQRKLAQAAWRQQTYEAYVTKMVRTPVEDLCTIGLTAEAAKRLRSKGYSNVGTILASSHAQLNNSGIAHKHLTGLWDAIATLQTTNPGACFKGTHTLIPLPPELQDPR